MRKIIAYIQLSFAYVFLLPHIVLFLISDTRTKLLIWQDIQVVNKKMSVRFTGINAMLYVILRDTYYRKLFYHRIGVRSFLISWYFPGERTFEPICDKIGGGIYLAHPSSTYLNAESIGTNFTCRQNTTIGNKKEGNKNSLPVIGDNVSVGANVCIIGHIRIGNNVIIGAGSVVVKDIPDNCIVAGNPAKVIIPQHE